MLFIDHFFKWCFAALLALVVTLFLGGLLVRISMSFIDPRRVAQIAQRSVDASNLRLIGQAGRIYASDHQGRLPDATDLPDYARLLALQGGLNDPSCWVGSAERATLPADFKTILVNAHDGTRTLDPRFVSLPHLFTVVLGGLKADDPSTTPIAWTRGLDLETGLWRADSPYDGEGGHIVFLGGNVQFYRTLQTVSGGELVARDGHPTHRIRDALPPGARISPDSDASEPLPALSIRLHELLRHIPGAMRFVIAWAWPLWMLALFVKLTLATARTWGVPIARVRIERHSRWLVLTPVTLLLLSIVFQI